MTRLVLGPCFPGCVSGALLWFSLPKYELVEEGEMTFTSLAQGECCSAVFVADVFPVPGGAMVHCTTSPVLKAKRSQYLEKSFPLLTIVSAKIGNPPGLTT